MRLSHPLHLCLAGGCRPDQWSHPPVPGAFTAPVSRCRAAPRPRTRTEGTVTAQVVRTRITCRRGTWRGRRVVIVPTLAEVTTVDVDRGSPVAAQSKMTPAAENSCCQFVSRARTPQPASHCDYDPPATENRRASKKKATDHPHRPGDSATTRSKGSSSCQGCCEHTHHLLTVVGAVRQRYRRGRGPNPGAQFVADFAPQTQGSQPGHSLDRAAADPATSGASRMPTSTPITPTSRASVSPPQLTAPHPPAATPAPARPPTRPTLALVGSPSRVVHHVKATADQHPAASTGASR